MVAFSLTSRYVPYRELRPAVPTSEGLERMMTAIVTACSSFGLTVSEAKTEIMCLETKSGGKVSSRSMQPARFANKQSSLYTWAGL